MSSHMFITLITDYTSLSFFAKMFLKYITKCTEHHCINIHLLLFTAYI